MKSFAYTAKNPNGELVSGVIETKDFLDASLDMKRRGLELVSLNEREQIHQLTPFIFDAVDQAGEPVQGTIKAASEEEVKKKLQEDFGYQVKTIHPKEESQTTQVIKASAKPPEHDRREAIARAKEALSARPQETSAEEKIIFKREIPTLHPKMVIPHEEIDRLEQKVEMLLSEKEGKISQGTRQRLNFLKKMIALIHSNQNKKHWKNLKREVQSAEEIALREIREKEEKEWKALEEQNPGKKVDSYTKFSKETPVPLFAADGKIAKMMKWFKMIDFPDENNEQQILLKQQYESVWFELQRFSGALFAFYLLCFFGAYYLKRSGVSDHVLIRIYDTALFKQLILGLFSLYALLTVRMDFLTKRMKTDAAVVLGWLVILALVFW